MPTTAMITNESAADMIFRAKCATEIADLLVKAKTAGSVTQVKDLPPKELRAHYHEIAEMAVSMACDRQQYEGADYYACEAIAQLNDADLERWPLEKRLKIVREFRAGLSNWLRLFRHGSPQILMKYGLIAQSDVTKVAFERAKASGCNVLEFPEGR